MWLEVQSTLGEPDYGTINYLGGSMALSKHGPTQCRNYMSFGVAGHADYAMRAGLLNCYGIRVVQWRCHM